MDISFFLGLDLGQVHDFTALTLTERFLMPLTPKEKAAHANAVISWPVGAPTPPEAKTPPKRYRYACQKLKRMRGAPYHEIVDHVTGVMEQPMLAGKTVLVVDGSGVGRSVVDDLRRKGLTPVALTITGGNTVSRAEGYIRVPKIELVTVMQMLLQSGRLLIDKDLPAARILEAELLNFKAKITDSANMTFGAGAAPDWRDGAHDDLVLSLACALWHAEKLARRSEPMPQRSGSHAARHFPSDPSIGKVFEPWPEG